MLITTILGTCPIDSSLRDFRLDFDERALRAATLIRDEVFSLAEPLSLRPLVPLYSKMRGYCPELPSDPLYFSATYSYFVPCVVSAVLYANDLADLYLLPSGLGCRLRIWCPFDLHAISRYDVRAPALHTQNDDVILSTEKRVMRITPAPLPCHQRSQRSSPKPISEITPLSTSFLYSKIAKRVDTWWVWFGPCA